jgi:hypothetical protein
MENPSENQEDVLDYQQTLSFSQRIRRRIIDKVMEDGEVPNDPKAVDTLLKTLKDMDQTALADRKNQIDQKDSDTSREVADAMRQMLEMQKNANPFARRDDGSVAAPTVVPSVSVEKLGEHKLVEGETEIGVISENCGDFMTRMQALKGESD